MIIKFLKLMFKKILRADRKKKQRMCMSSKVRIMLISLQEKWNLEHNKATLLKYHVKKKKRVVNLQSCIL